MTRLENTCAIVELNDGILIGSLKVDYIDVSIAKDAVICRLQISKGLLYPFLIKINSVKNITKEARDFLASEKGCEGVLAAAILIDSIIASMIGNFFTRISKPLVPTRLFTNEGEAKKWLAKYKI